MRCKKKPRLGIDLSLSLSVPSSSPTGVGGGASDPAAGDDRFTDLPDALRLHVLSLLPLKFAIRTGVLSSRWRDLWRYRWPQPAALHLSPSALSSSSSSSGSGGGGSSVAAADDFAVKVDACLLSRGRDHPLDALCVSVPTDRRYDAELKRWLEYAAACGVEDLRLDIFDSSGPSDGRRRGGRRRYYAAISSVLCSSICDCSNLTRLVICGLQLPSPSRFKRLSSLEVLSLHGTQITDAAIKNIIPCCPNLRSLDLRQCRKLRDILIHTIGNRLSSFTMMDCSRASRLVVKVPNLRCFRFRGSFLTTYSIDNVKGLEDVYMSSGFLPSLPRSNWVKELGALLNVKVLTLCSLSIQYIVVSGADAFGQFRNFRRLTELQLLMTMMADGNLTDIYAFFRLCACPKLEKLYIELPCNMWDSSMEKLLPVPEEEPPDVDFQHLKMLKINNFKGHKNEMQLVKFLLAKASSLESLLLIAPQHLLLEESNKNGEDSYSHVLQFLEQLPLLPRASPDAQVTISNFDDYKFRPIHLEINAVS